jgi:hypothetical protein
MKMNDRQDLQTHAGDFANAIMEYESVSQPMDFEDKKMHLLNSLPPSYAVIITDLESDVNVNNWEYVMSRLLDTEASMKMTGKTKSETNAQMGASNASRDKRHIECYNRGKKGHYQKDSWQKKKENDFGENSRRNGYQGNFRERGRGRGRGKGRDNGGGKGSAYNANTEDQHGPPHVLSAFTVNANKRIEEKSDWILDSGCTDHMVNDNVKLTNYKKTENWPVNSS